MSERRLLNQPVPETTNGIAPAEADIDKLLHEMSVPKAFEGIDLKEAFYSRIDDALSSEGIHSLGDGREVSLENIRSNPEAFVALANKFFETNNYNYRARIISDHPPKILIVGKIGEDYFYVVSNQGEVSFLPRKIIAFTAIKFGLVDKDGRVFSIDRIFKPKGKTEEEESTILFVMCSGKRFSFKGTVYSPQESKSTDIITSLPETVEDFAEILHEIGHGLLIRALKKQPNLYKIFMQAGDIVDKETRESLFTPDKRLSRYHIRRIKVQHERTAWAIAMYLLRKARDYTALSCTSLESMQTAIRRAQKALETYDSIPYYISEHLSERPIPQFSDRRRRYSRRLHKILEELGLPYSRFFDFDPDTGISFGNRPELLLSKILEFERILR